MKTAKKQIEITLFDVPEVLDYVDSTADGLIYESADGDRILVSKNIQPLGWKFID